MCDLIPLFGLWIGDHGLTARVFRKFVAIRPPHLSPAMTKTAASIASSRSASAGG
jgi:hypothetical protein